MSFVTACVTYGGFFGTFNSLGMYRAMKDMLTLGELEGVWQAGAGVFYTLTVFFISRVRFRAITSSIQLTDSWTYSLTHMHRRLHWRRSRSRFLSPVARSCH